MNLQDKALQPFLTPVVLSPTAIDIQDDSQSYINTLPNELFHHIFSMLSAQDLGRSRRVSHHWRFLADYSVLWRTLYERSVSLPPEFIFPSPLRADDWKAKYIYFHHDPEAMMRSDRKPKKSVLKDEGTRYGVYIKSVAFSPNGRQLAAASSDGSVYLRDGFSGELLSMLKHNFHRDIDAHVLSFSPTGEELAVGYSGFAIIFDTASYTLKCHINLQQDVTDIRYLADAKTLLITDARGGINTYNRDLNCITKISNSFQKRDEHYRCFLWVSQVTESLATEMGFDLEDVNGQQCIFSNGYASAIAFSPFNDSLLAVGVSSHGHGYGKIHRIYLWDTNKEIPNNSFEVPTRVNALAFTSNGFSLIIGGEESVEIRDVFTGKCIREIKQSDFSYCRSLAISPDGCRLAVSGSEKNKVTLHDFNIQPDK